MPTFLSRLLSVPVDRRMDDRFTKSRLLLAHVDRMMDDPLTRSGNKRKSTEMVAMDHPCVDMRTRKETNISGTDNLGCPVGKAMFTFGRPRGNVTGSFGRPDGRGCLLKKQSNLLFSSSKSVPFRWVQKKKRPDEDKLERRGPRNSRSHHWTSSTLTC